MFLENYNLSMHTTYRIGGQAAYFSICHSNEELQRIVSWCRDKALPWFILGNGSNILISDDGFPGVVIKLSGAFKMISFDSDVVRAGAGVLLPTMSRNFLARGWGGFEFMCGIPGTIGGAVRVNAGTKKGEIQDSFLSATILSHDGKVRTFSKEEMQFSFRHSRFATTRDIILSANFSRPYVSDKNTIQEKIKKIIADRRQKQPTIRRNCGSVFKSPPEGKPAGWYIDQAGFKGMRIGDAMVSHEHANWIVNLGNAKSEHVKCLINKIQNEVLGCFGVQLEREVIYVPEDILERLK